MSRLNFQLEARALGSRARAGRFRTLHGEVRTPTFMPVGTNATVRGQRFETLRETGAQVLLANTYHLLLRPGPEVFRKLGGIHKFMGWEGSVLTDSGGFQIFSLPHSREMTEKGAVFQSYVDCRRILLTPELSIETQVAIGSDIMMVLDQCVPGDAPRALAEEAMHLTHRWARRSLEARGDSPQALFGIVQGACFPELRRESAEQLTELGFDGFALGGLAVGESKEAREEITEFTAQCLPENLPRYLMGVGTPIDLLEAVHRGVDMFDCILPNSLAQQGVAYTSLGRIDLRRGVYRLSEEKLDPSCRCRTCAQYSRAYLHHLIKAGEILGWQLVGAHNLSFYQNLMEQIRERILTDRFAEFYREMREVLAGRDPENPIHGPRRRSKPRKHPQTLGDYEIQVTDRYASIRHRISGETMHSARNPEEEARRLYVEQSRLSEKLREPESHELVVWDVGLGAATNAMAAIRCRESLEAGRPLHVVSFERDLDSLRLALTFVYRFPHLKHPAPHFLLKEGAWASDMRGIRWTLQQGDFLETLEEAPAPDLIYFDPFSTQQDSALWRLECFRRIHARCQGRAVELFTYSSSTAARASLLAAGFFVAKGWPTGLRPETTRAFTSPGISAPFGESGLLGKEWLLRWSRSPAQLPPGVGAQDIEGHPQFREILWKT